MANIERVRGLVDALCDDACAGRRTGSPGGIRARGIMVEALRDAGLDARVEPLPSCNGANVLAMIPGDVDRWVLVGAHYDHLGAGAGGAIYRGANDNAAALAALVEVARSLTARRPQGRGVILAAFDAEEPPFYATGAMGSQAMVRAPPVPLDRIDMMVALELVGCAIGPAGLPDAIRNSLFALGAERSEGTAARLDALTSAGDDLFVRRADAEVIPPLSDHLAFWEAGVPFMLLTGLRSATYHTPRDTPDTLDPARIAAVARWLEAFVRDQCARPEGRVRFLADGRDDRSTLDAVRALLAPLAGLSPLTAGALRTAAALTARLDAKNRLGDGERTQLQALIVGIERALS